MAPARRLRTAWIGLTGTGATASVSLGLLMFCCVFLAMAGPRESLGLRTRALQHALSAMPSLAKSMAGNTYYTAFADGLSQPASAGDLAAERQRLAAGLARERLPLAPYRTGWAGLASGFFPVTGLPQRLYRNRLPPQLELLYRDELSSRARLIAGRLPASARLTRNGGIVQVAVTRATAARFGLRPGARIGTRAGITLLVTGIIRPVAARSAFWAADPVAAAPAQDQKSGNLPPYWAGGAFIGPAALPLLPQRVDPAGMSVSWDFPLVLGSVTGASAPALENELLRAGTQAGLPSAGGQPTIGEPVVLSSEATGVLASFIQQDQAASQLLSLLSVSLAIIGFVVILLGAQLVAERRRGEFGVLRARGASRAQLAWLALRAGTTVTVPAAVGGAALAIGLTPGGTGPLPWLLAGGTVAVALASLPLITAFQHRLARLPAGTGHGGRPGGRGVAVRRLAAEIALLAASAGGLALLRQQDPGPAGGSTVYTSMAPVLVAVPAAIIITRCYPVVLRASRRLARIRPGVTAFVGLARAAQAARGAILPVFALILALSVVTFGAMVRAAVVRGEVAASWQQAGADAVIDASPPSRPLTQTAQRAICAVSGVQHTAGVIVVPGSARGQALTVAAVRPSQYAALIAATPGRAFPAAKLAGPASAAGDRRGAVPALASRAAAAILGQGSNSLEVGTRSITIRVSGIASPVPGAGSGALVVLPQRALGISPPAPAIMLVVGAHLDVRQLQAVVRRALPGSSVTFRSAVLASLARAPLPRGTYLAIAAGIAAAFGLSMLIMLIALVLSARTRELTVTRLRVLGLEPGRARWLEAVEVLPLILAAVAGGIACAWAMAPLIGNSLDLSVFTGTTAAVPIHPEPASLAAAAGGLLILAALILAAQTITAGRGGAAFTLRRQE